MRALAEVVKWWDDNSFDLFSGCISRCNFREILELPGGQQVDEHNLEPIDERHISGIEIDDGGAISFVIQGSGNVTLVDGGNDGMDFASAEVSLLVRFTMEKDAHPDNMAELENFGLEERG